MIIVRAFIKALMHRVKAVKFAITHVKPDSIESDAILDRVTIKNTTLTPSVEISGNEAVLDGVQNGNTTLTPPVEYSRNTSARLLEDGVQFCLKTELKCLTHNVDLEERKSRKLVSRKTSTGVYRKGYKMVRILTCPAWLRLGSKLEHSDSVGEIIKSESESTDAAISRESTGLKRKSRK